MTVPHLRELLTSVALAVVAFAPLAVIVDGALRTVEPDLPRVLFPVGGRWRLGFLRGVLLYAALALWWWCAPARRVLVLMAIPAWCLAVLYGVPVLISRSVRWVLRRRESQKAEPPECDPHQLTAFQRRET